MPGIRGKGPVYRLERSGKARMIEAVLADFLGATPSGLRTLDIGCGNGDISRHFAECNEHHGVDTIDRRKPANRNFSFRVVDSELLPHEDDFFDVVLSNHVIEHVSNQRLHLLEAARVLKPGGILYLATPNRSSPIMQGHVGNNHVLRYHQMYKLFGECSLEATEYSTRVVRHPGVFHSAARGFSMLPEWILFRLRRWFPSHVFILKRANQARINTPLSTL